MPRCTCTPSSTFLWNCRALVAQAVVPGFLLMGLLNSESCRGGLDDPFGEEFGTTRRIAELEQENAVLKAKASCVPGLAHEVGGHACVCVCVWALSLGVVPARNHPNGVKLQAAGKSRHRPTVSLCSKGLGLFRARR